MKHFKFYNKQDILYLTKIRRFETKLGEMVQVIDDQNNLEKSLNDTISKYVLIGIPEDIGVRANGGVGGADTAWLPFLQSFFNIQSNDFLLGDEVLVMGAEPLEGRGIIAVHKGRYRVRERNVLRYYARSIAHLLTPSGPTH